MTSKPISFDEKNQKKETQPSQGKQFPNTLGLREAAKIIKERAYDNRKGLDVGRLLGALQQGKLRTGFHFPGQIPTWVEIEATYWVGVTTERFLAIRSSGKHSEGGFTVRIRDLAEKMVPLLLQDSNQNGVKDLVQALREANRKLEVKLVMDERWDEFLDEVRSKALNDSSAEAGGPKRGRQELTGWKTVNQVLAAYLVANKIDRKSQIPLEKIANEVLIEAKRLDEGKSQLPGLATLTKEITHVFDLVKRYRPQD